MTELTHRRATMEDRDALAGLIEAAITQLQRSFLTPSQIESSRAIMGLDTQLIADGTYYVVHVAGVLAGCGGWSFRSTAYGGDASTGRIQLG